MAKTHKPTSGCSADRDNEFCVRDRIVRSLQATSPTLSAATIRDYQKAAQDLIRHLGSIRARRPLGQITERELERAHHACLRELARTSCRKWRAADKLNDP